MKTFMKKFYVLDCLFARLSCTKIKEVDFSNHQLKCYFKFDFWAQIVSCIKKSLKTKFLAKKQIAQTNFSITSNHKIGFLHIYFFFITAKLDGVKTYMRLRRVPNSLQNKVIKWFDYLWLTQKSSDEEKAVSCLPGK